MVALQEFLQAARGEMAAHEPIIICAPTQRCGSTLLQRVFNRGGEAVIYGENFFLLENMPETIEAPLRALQHRIDVTNRTEAAFYGGNKGVDATTLFPDYRGYITQVLSSYLQILEYYRLTTEEKGGSRWGLKHQIKNLPGFRMFLALVPAAQIVVIYRDVLHVARSYRARWPERMQKREHFVAFGQRWRRNTRFLLNLKRRKLVIKYETLIADPEPFVAQLRERTGAAMGEEEFQRKVNVNETGKVGDGYIPPAELTPEEKQWVLEGANPLYHRLGYTGQGQ